jgi:nicotinamide phosphoribosyltransferase
LWDLFGGTMSNQGFKMLDPHIGAIYGDSINLVRAKQICERLRAKGFASTNIVLGIGSFTYQYNTRDTFGFAMKATYGEVVKDGKVERKEIWKDPVTDDGTKKSAKGLLRVNKSFDPREGYTLTDQCDWDAANEMGELKTVFKNGELVTKTTLAEIRERLKYEYTPTPE